MQIASVMSSNTDPNNDGANAEDLARFVELYTQYYQRLQYYVMALMPASHDAADVLQETSVVLWKKFGEFEAGTNFFAWACAIARRQALQHHARNRRSASRLEADVLAQLAAEAVDMSAQSSAAMTALRSCLEKLPEKDRELIRRRYEPDTSVKAMAEHIGVSANLLSKSLGKIRRSLLACISRKLAAQAR